MNIKINDVIIINLTKPWFIGNIISIMSNKFINNSYKTNKNNNKNGADNIKTKNILKCVLAPYWCLITNICTGNIKIKIFNCIC